MNGLRQGFEKFALIPEVIGANAADHCHRLTGGPQMTGHVERRAAEEEACRERIPQDLAYAEDFSVHCRTIFHIAVPATTYSSPAASRPNETAPEIVMPGQVRKSATPVPATRKLRSHPRQ